MIEKDSRDLRFLLRAHTRRGWLTVAMLTAALVAITGLAVASGSVSLPLDEVFESLRGGGTVASRGIVLNLRLTRALTAMASGASLGVSGLLLQTLFRNPLAEPYLLGVTSGSALGVALVVFGAGWTTASFATGLSVVQSLGLIGASGIGATLVLVVMLTLSSLLRNTVAVLLVGVMLGAFARGAIYVLIAFASPEEVQIFALWETGSFRGVGWPQMPLFLIVSSSGLAFSFLTPKALNAFVLGEDYARSMGVDVRSLRIVCLGSAAVLAGVITTFCGPIAFLGLAVPHIARGLLGDTDHRWLLPSTALLGSALALICSLVCELPGSGTGVTLPINAATSVLGAPVVIWVLLRWRKTRGSAE